MAFGLFRPQPSPVLVDFGSAGVKLLQVAPGDTPEATGAAYIPLPDDVRTQPVEARLDHIARELPAAMKRGGFRGNRVLLAPFSQHMLVNHVGIPQAESDRVELVSRTQVGLTLGCDPQSLVVRPIRVCETTRDGQPKIEVIVFAMSRDDVMRYVDLFKRVKLGVAGIHGEIHALVHAFDHLNRRDDDANLTSMYVDLGYGSTKVAICHGTSLVFAKSIGIGGRTFDSRIAEARRIGLAEARHLRLSEGIKPMRPEPAPASGIGEGMALLRAAVAQVEAPAPAPAPRAVLSVSEAVRETVESISEEIAMCTRYHSALFRERRVDRVIFAGGEARDVGLCQWLASRLRLPAKGADPLARFLATTPPPAGLPDPGLPHPGWAVTCGLASCPADL